MSRLQIADFVRPALIAPLLLLVYAYVLVVSYDNPLALVTIGARYAPSFLDAYAYSAEGYDGQSVYYIARFGWEAIPYLDVPAYRLQRILLPVLGAAQARLMGGTESLHYALLIVNLLALSGGTLALERLLEHFDTSRWLALGYGLSVGVFGAARLTTTETLAYGLVIAALLSAAYHRVGWAAALLGLAGLAKETTLIFVAAYGLWWAGQRDAVRLGMTLALGGGPFALWQIVLYGQVGAFGVGSGGEQATSFELIPLMGVLRILAEGSLSIFLALLPILFIFVLLPTLWALSQVWRDVRTEWASQHRDYPRTERSGISVWTCFLGLNALVMLFVPFSTYREILGILRFIVGLQVALIAYAAFKKQRRVLIYSTLWALTSLFVILSDAASAP
ncbi:MAG: hypothetical protein NZ750_08530 [Anaerolineae bacterium]|nr:hypothetical protein [Anaerolineae bacterium]MDW8172415.1 hypothetical protein [Anaerolineae bacterium]